MKRCVIFDMDGVIIDSEPLHIRCEKEMFRKFGIAVPDGEHHTFVGTSDKTLWSHMDSLYGLPVEIGEAIRLTQSLFMEYLSKEPIVPIPGIVELIASLSENGFILALASSSPHEQINFILDRFRIRQHFHTTVSGEDMKAGKPDPGIFLKAAELAGVDPQDCLVVEDSYNGVTAAKRAGMKCIGFVNPNSGNHDLSQADKIVHSPAEISYELVQSLLES